MFSTIKEEKQRKAIITMRKSQETSAEEVHDINIEVISCFLFVLLTFLFGNSNFSKTNDDLQYKFTGTFITAFLS